MKTFRLMIFIVWSCMAVWSFVIPAVAAEKEPLEVTVRQNVCAAYEVTHDQWDQGVASGLFTIKAELGFYQEMGVPLKQLDLHAVIHGDAGYFMLTDEAYNRVKGTDSGNPNKEIIRELTQANVSIELCSQTMKHNGWSAKDILPAVTIVFDAYSRLVDLQLQDFAYLKF